jgi:integrase
MTRPVSTGSYRERRPGVWQLRVGGGIDVNGKQVVVTATVRGDEAKAKRELARLVRRRLANKVRVGVPTVAEHLAAYLDDLDDDPDTSPTTVRSYRSYVSRHIVPAIGDIQIDRVTVIDLEGIYRTMLRAGRRPSTVRQVHAILSGALAQAERHDLIASNPAKRARVPSAQRPEVVPPDVDLVRRLLVEADAWDPETGRLLLIAATTGLRRGELCGLRVSDIDIDAGVLHVRRSVATVKGGTVVKGTKTHQGRRLAVDPVVLAALGAQVADLRAVAALTGRALVDDPFLFPAAMDPTAGTPRPPDTVTGAFRRLCQRASVDGTRLHDLRHFVATQALAAGADVRTVAGQLGHGGGGAVTLRVYAHLVEDRQRELARTLGALVAPRG